MIPQRERLAAREAGQSVSGRSDLSWDDSVRIDVRYVENWSLTSDLMILWKTVGAVVRGRGAY